MGSSLIHLIRTDSNEFFFNGWVIFHGVYVPQLPHPFVCWWASRLLPRPVYYKQCCDEHWGARVSFRSGQCPFLKDQEIWPPLCVLPWAQTVKNLPAIQETWIQSLGQEEPLEKGMATHSSILAWRIPWTEEPGRLQSMVFQSQTQLSD